MRLARLVLAIIGASWLLLLVRDFGMATTLRHGIIDDGSFRGIEIGMSRADVMRVLLGQSRLKLVASQKKGQGTCIVGLQKSECTDVSRADIYHALYSAWYYESVSVYFSEDTVEKVEFTRRVAYIDI